MNYKRILNKGFNREGDIRMNYSLDIFTQFDKKWALVTAGNEDSFNTMTISWGGMGTIWNKPVATVYVRTSRYTHEFIDNNDYFTISFFPEEYKKILGVLGSKSGREMDKMHASGLTPVQVENGITFKEAETTFVCRKLCKQPIELQNMPEDVVNSFYKADTRHDMYIGEVIKIIQ